LPIQAALYHIGTAAHARTHVLLLVHDLHIRTQPAPLDSTVFTAVINLVAGVAVISLLSGVARSAIRKGRAAGGACPTAPVKPPGFPGPLRAGPALISR
jgi:hypothetical protein